MPVMCFILNPVESRMRIEPSTETLISKVVTQAKQIADADLTIAVGRSAAIRAADELCGDIVALRWNLLQAYQRDHGSGQSDRDRTRTNPQSTTIPVIKSREHIRER